MQTHVHTHHFNSCSRDNHIVIWNMSDVHFGNVLVDKTLLKRHLELIKSYDSHYVIFGGDTLDGIVLGDKRHQHQSLDPDLFKKGDDYQSTLDRCIDNLCALLEPVKKKIIGFAEGNHELTADKLAQTRVTRRLAAALNTVHFGYSFGLGIKLIYKPKTGSGKRVTRQYIGYIHHGSGSAQTKGGKLNRGINMANHWEGIDFHMRGHTHEPLITPMVRGSLAWASSQEDLMFTARDFVIVQSGSYLKSRSLEVAGVPNTKNYSEPYNAYSEIREYPLVHLGMRGVRLRHREHRVTGVSPDDYEV